MSSIGKLMKQAARMQRQVEELQAQLAQRTVRSSSGGGAVEVVARCDNSIASIKINPQAITPDDPELLEDLLLTAVNSALAQSREIYAAEMGKATSGFGLPGLT